MVKLAILILGGALALAGLMASGVSGRVDPDAGGASAGPAAAARSVHKPVIHRRLIPFGAKRRHQMARYSKRHYGRAEWRLKRPRQIVEHVAVASSLDAIYNTFAPNRPDPELGERPNVCSHFAVSPKGRIIQMVGLNKRCRHTVGLNHVSIGIEHVGYSDGDVLNDARQLRASVRLTRWLRCRYGIGIKDVIGHNESLSSRFHRERVPSLKHQTHGDFRHASMRRYRKRLHQAGRCPKGRTSVAGGLTDRHVQSVDR